MGTLGIRRKRRKRKRRREEKEEKRGGWNPKKTGETTNLGLCSPIKLKIKLSVQMKEINLI